MNTGDSTTIVQFDQSQVVLDPSKKIRANHHVFIRNYRGAVLQFDLDTEQFESITDFPANSKNPPAAIASDHYIFAKYLGTYSLLSNYRSHFYAFDTTTRTTVRMSPDYYGNESSSIIRIQQMGSEVGVLMEDAILVSKQLQFKNALIYDSSSLSKSFRYGHKSFCGNSGFVLSTSQLSPDSFHLFNFNTNTEITITTPDSLPYRRYCHDYIYLGNIHQFTHRYYLFSGLLEQLPAQQIIESAQWNELLDDYILLKSNGTLRLLDRNLNTAYSLTDDNRIIHTSAKYLVFINNNQVITRIDLSTGAIQQITSAPTGIQITSAHTNQNALYFASRDFTTHKLFYMNLQDPNLIAEIIQIDTFVNYVGGFTYLAEINGKVHCAIQTKVRGQEWYRVNQDKTLTQVTDINDANGSARIFHAEVVGNRIFFSADDGYHGRELWSYGDCFLADLTTVRSSATTPTGKINTVISGGQAPFSFQWSNGANTPNLSSGIYLVTITDAQGCVATLHTLVESEQFLLNSPEDRMTLTVYPNPTFDQLSISMIDANDRSSYLVRIVDNQGKIRAEDTWTAGDAFNAPIRNLPSGVYWIHLTSKLSQTQLVASFYKQ